MRALLLHRPVGGRWSVFGDGKRDIWDTYTVAADTITIQETGRTGPIPRDCKGPGVYKFSRSNENTLTFTLVNDACGLRKKNVLLAQHRK